MVDDRRDDRLDDQERPRASLRGKGREILLGQRNISDAVPDDALAPAEIGDAPPDTVDAEALSLTPAEAESVLDFSPDSSLELVFPAQDTADAADRIGAVGVLDIPGADDLVVDDLPVPDDYLLDWMAERDQPEAVDMAVDMGIDEVPDDMADAAAPQEAEEGYPLAEREAAFPIVAQPVTYQPDSTVDILNPQEPELWPAEFPVGEWPEIEATADGIGNLHNGGLVVPEGAVEKQPATGFPDPFPALERQPSRVLFQPTETSDQALLATLVNDERIQRLFDQIEALQDRLAEEVWGDRSSADVYQQELLQASSLLLQSRENYDDARAIVYRVRTDLNRQRKVEADVNKFRPSLHLYYLGWVIALGVLALLKALFAGVAEAVGVGIVASLYYPTLLGVAGALLSGFLTLERHTTKLRDFDPIHISWYLFNPLLGGAMGVLMFLLASIANEDLFQDTASAAEKAIAYLLCVVAGMNQNHVLRQLNDLLKRFDSQQ